MLAINPKILVTLVFFLIYIYLIFFKRRRGFVIWLGIGILGLFSLLSQDSFLSIINIPYFINWNVMGIFAGTLILAEIFIYSKVPALLADLLVDRSKNVGMAILWVCVLSSLISAFVENVATVLIVAPIALVLAKKLKVSPVPFLIGLAISSNLQGTATLIGDPPSMILAGNLRMSFNDFFIYNSKPGIFFAVQLGALSSFVVLYLYFRRYKDPVVQVPKEKVTSWMPTIFLLGLIIALALSPLADPEFQFLGGVICIVFGFAGIFWQFLQDRDLAREIWKRFDWDTTFFLAGIFVLVGIFNEVGLITILKNVLIRTLGDSPFINYTFFVWFSVLISAFIDNVPYLTAMIPVTIQLSAELGIPPYLLSFGLLIGTCLGGNVTPIGASANIVSVGILKRDGYSVSFWQFVKIGLPFTLAATLVSYIFIWFVWG
jgi:Na+/H+ antiporter NhaD/arsenite permease-like protein